MLKWIITLLYDTSKQVHRQSFCHLLISIHIFSKYYWSCAVILMAHVNSNLYAICEYWIIPQFPIQTLIYNINIYKGILYMIIYKPIEYSIQFAKGSYSWIPSRLLWGRIMCISNNSTCQFINTTNIRKHSPDVHCTLN